MGCHLSLVAKYCAGRLGVAGRLVSGYSLPPLLPPTSPASWITWGARVGVTERDCSLIAQCSGIC